MTSSPPRDSLKWENRGDFSAESTRKERIKEGRKERKKEEKKDGRKEYSEH